MNKIFKIVFNAARGKMMVVNEATSSVQTGKKAAVTVAVIGALAAGAANAAEVEVISAENTTGATLLVVNVDNPNGQNIVGDKSYELTVNKPTTGAQYVTAKTVGQSFSDAKAGNAVNTTFKDNVTISHVNNTERNVTGNAAAFGVDIYSGELNFEGNTTVTVSSTQTHGINATGIRAWGYQNDVYDLDATLNFTGEQLNVTVTNANTQERDSDPQWKESQSSAIGISLSQAGSIVVSEDTVTNVNVTATGIANAYGLEHSGGGISQFGAQIGGDATFTVNANEGNAYGVSLDTQGYTHTTGSYEGVAEATFNGDLTVNATTKKGQFAYGVLAKTGSTFEATGDVTIVASNEREDNIGNNTPDAAGVRALSSNVTLGGETSVVDITSSSKVGYAHGIQVRYDSSSATNPEKTFANAVVNGDKLHISSSAGEYGYGLTVQGINTPSTTSHATLNVNSNVTDIEASGVGVFASGASLTNINSASSISIKAPMVVEARNDAVVNVNMGENAQADVALDGDIVFSKAYNNSVNTAVVSINLNTANSYLNGNVKTLVNDGITAADGDFVGSKFKLTLANGAQWNATANSFVTDLTLNDGYVSIDGGEAGATVTVDTNLAGSGATIALGSEADKFEFVGDEANNTLGSVKVTLADQTADTVDAEEAKALIDNVSGVANVEAFVAEGEVGGAIVVGADGKVVQAVNAKTEALAEQVTLAPQMITRIMMNDVRKRMGDLRAAEGTHGVWARYNGGQMSGQGMDADFHMVQVGVDTVPVVDAPRFGVAFSYAQTESEDNLGGSADMDSFSLAFYGTKMYDNGMFVDVIGRMATVDTEMNVLGNKAEMDNVALSVSGELGWRFDVTDSFFIEPSVEATYTYTNADTFTMGNGKYELEAVDSLVGRAGFAAGFKCPANKGDVYVRAAVVHEFMGDSTMNSWGADGRMAKPVEMDGKDTWFEYAIGANFNVNKNTYVYADVERTSGANVDEDWRANVGVRFAF